MGRLNLIRAAKFAARDCATEKNFFLGCIAIRQDGAEVKSRNSKVQNPHPDGHAEAKVLKKTGKGAILWVARVLKDGKTWAMAKPCPKCQILIKNKGVERVYYTIGPGEHGVWDPQKTNE